MNIFAKTLNGDLYFIELPEAATNKDLKQILVTKYPDIFPRFLTTIAREDIPFQQDETVFVFISDTYYLDFIFLYNIPKTFCAGMFYELKTPYVKIIQTDIDDLRGTCEKFMLIECEHLNGLLGRHYISQPLF